MLNKSWFVPWEAHIKLRVTTTHRVISPSRLVQLFLLFHYNFLAIFTIRVLACKFIELIHALSFPYLPFLFSHHRFFSFLGVVLQNNWFSALLVLIHVFIFDFRIDCWISNFFNFCLNSPVDTFWVPYNSNLSVKIMSPFPDAINDSRALFLDILEP